MTDFKELVENIADSKGYFLIENRGGQAYLCVYPYSYSQKTTSFESNLYEEIINRLQLFDIQYDVKKVKEIIERADGKWYEIGIWKEPESEDAKFEIRISEDYRKAYLDIVPPVYKGKWFHLEDLKKAIHQSGIKIGVKEDLLEKIAKRELKELQEKGDWKKTYVIAEAIEPVSPTNGQIRFYFDPDPRAKPKEDEHGKVDFRSLNVIQICSENQLLAEIIPPVMGKDGVDVVGNLIPAEEPKEAKLEAGENTELRNAQLFSLISGQVKMQMNHSKDYVKISVAKILEIDNVDFSTGNIDFPGTVRIRNRVVDGFRVKAKEDIIIEKSVGNVKLFSGGDIILYGGILSQDQGYVFSEGNVYAKFIQNSRVNARKNIYVEDLILHSEIMAGEEIHIFQGKGELIGGVTYCGKKLIARKIGSVAEPLTRIYLGIHPDILLKINEIGLQIEKNQKLLMEIEKNKNYLEDHPEKLKEENKESFYQKLILAREKLNKIIDNLIHQKELLLNSQKTNLESRLYIQEVIFPNVELILGTENKKYKQWKTPLRKRGYFQYDKQSRLVRFYSTNRR